MDDDDRQAEPVPDASGQPLPPPDAPAPGAGTEGAAADTAAPSTVAPSAGAPGTAAPGTAAPGTAAPSTVAPSAGAAATVPEGGGAPSTPAPSTAAEAPPRSGASETDDPELARIAEALPNYEIGGQLGRGGWGVVYEGRHRQLGREVAIKQLPPGFSTDPEVRARFLAEARALAALDHPHVVPVYDFVDKDGLCLLVMEKLSGGTVWSRFATEGLSMEAACAAVLATCAGLQSAHAHQILHRDIKPENLIFNAEGTLKVTDFGIAKMLSGQRTMATRAGEVMGTPAYMAPEQARGQQVTPATDVYAVGVMLYELLAGRRPFEDEEDDPLAMLFKQAYEDPQRLEEVAPHVPGPLVNVTMKALAKDPADRYQSAEDFGVAVAEAATEAWGPGWLMRASLPVMAAGSMVAATERITADLDAAGSRGVSVTVKPQDAVRERAPDAHRPADASNLVPVEDVVPRPPSALPAWLGTAVLLAAVVFVAFFVRIGSPDRTGTINPGTLRLAGQDPSAGRVVQIDMSDDFVVEGALPAPEATQIEVAFSAAGVPMGSGRSTVAANPDGTFRAEVDPSASRWMLSGRGTGELNLSAADGEVVSSQQFEVDSTQTSFMTGPFVAAVLALFFLLGYVESMMRALRRGRRRLPSLIGLPIIAVPIGVALSIVAWAATGPEPTRASVAATAAVAAAAGLVAGWGALRSGRVRQHKRAEAAKARAEAASSSAR